MKQSYKKPPIYTGVFFDADNLYRQVGRYRISPLEKQIPSPHVTVSYMPYPFEVNEQLYGTEVTVTVVGYANDEKNEGVRVKLDCENEKLKTLFSRITVPHITLSVARDSKPVRTGALTFSPVDDQIELRGKYGAFYDDGVRCESDA